MTHKRKIDKLDVIKIKALFCKRFYKIYMR